LFIILWRERLLLKFRSEARNPFEHEESSS
jgi:hypothetical protein